MAYEAASQECPKSVAQVSGSAHPIPWAVLIIFFVSGMAALIDQIVWTRALHRVFGVTAEAAGTVLATFMLGLALGSHVFGRWVDRGWNSLRMYGWMEVAIGLIAPLTPWVFLALQPVYAWMARWLGLESGALPVARALLCMVVLLPPTVLMGGTLPVLAKGFLRRQPGRVVGLLYSVNTWGAVLGCFLAGFVLLGVLGETRSLLLASAGNVVAGVWALQRASGDREIERPRTSIGPRPGGRVLVYLVSFVNGFAALALEVLWGRAIGLVTDASVYAFTCIIGTFLVGIALGSRAAAGWADRSPSPLAVLGAMIGAMGVLLCVATRGFFLLIPESALGGSLVHVSETPLLVPIKLLGLASGVVLPVTLLSGACFPFMARIVIPGDGREGRELGGLYSVNTIGGILGAAFAGFAMLPLLGDQGSFALIAIMYLGSGGACLLAARLRIAGLVVPVAGACLALILLPPRGSLSRGLVERWGKSIARHVETPSATISALTLPDGQKHLLVNGMGMTVLCTDTKFMAHLPLLLHPRPKNILVICFGMGTTFRSASRHPVEVTAVELQRAVPMMFDYFHADAELVRRQNGRHIRIADGRNFLLVSPETYSVITIDPAPPMHSAGTVNLYTREFFELCRGHLDDDGVMSLWIPDKSCTDADFRLLVKTFRTVFPQVQLWYGAEGLGYYLVGSQRPLLVRRDRLAALMNMPAVQADIREYGTHPGITEQALLDMYIMGNRGIDRLTASETRVLTDDRPYTEFPWLAWVRAGRGIVSDWMAPQKLLPYGEAPASGVFPSR